MNKRSDKSELPNWLIYVLGLICTKIHAFYSFPHKERPEKARNDTNQFSTENGSTNCVRSPAVRQGEPNDLLRYAQM